MKLFDTANLTEAVMKSLSKDEAANIYNGLDCCVTAEIFNVLKDQMDDEEECVKETYDTALNKLAPFLEMSLRGLLVDRKAKIKAIAELEIEYKNLDNKFQTIMQEIVGGPVNINSPVQLKQLFYTTLGIKPIKARTAAGHFAPTTNSDAMEYIAERYIHAGLIANFVLALRTRRKSISFLQTEIDKDGRIRTNYNITGTTTGRLSSASSDFGTGTNLQNVDRALRFAFVADPGMIFVNIDLEQADARNLGAIAWNIFFEQQGAKFAGSFLDACESGDLHTTVSNMVWPDLAWPEDKALWKKFCDGEILHGQDSYRQGSKKIGHGTNYYGKARTVAKHAFAPVKLVEDFQQKYFKAFPVIPAWHKWVIHEIKTTGTLYNLFGRRRMFFGRGKDDAVHRKAIAYAPQSTTGEQIDRGILRVHRHFSSDQVQLLAQVHDSILLQVPYKEHEVLIPQILEVMEVVKTLKGGRKFSVPLEAKVGWNWGDFDYKNPQKNPHGLKAWTGKETRTRPSPHSRLKDWL